MAQNLFNLSQTAATESNKPLVSFRAGKCTFANGTVTPINKKGLVQVLQTPDSLLHFQWKDRTTGTVEDDLIIFPDEAQFVKAKEDARVLLLKFTSGRKLFFWLQEPKDDKDKEYEEKTNQYINNPPLQTLPCQVMYLICTDLPALRILRRVAGLDHDDVGLSGVDESQLRQMFQNVGAANQARPEPTRAPATTTPAPAATATPTPTTTPTAATTPAPATSAPATTTPAPATTNTSAPTTATPTPAAASTTPSAAPAAATTVNTNAPRQASSGPANQAQLSADMAASLSSILAGFGMPQAQQGEDTDLQEVLLPELILPLLSSDPDALKELFSHLPQGTQNLAGFSPQFGQTIDAFTHVLHSGHANSLMTMFGFDPMLAGPVGVMDVNSFITALKASIEKNAKK